MSYSAKQLHDLWLQTVREVEGRTPDGSDGMYAWQAAAVALAESGGNPDAAHTNSNGTIDRGLWQINSVHGDAMSTFDPQANAHAAYTLWKSGHSWRPWATAWSHPWSSGYGDTAAPAWKIYLSPSFKKGSQGTPGGQAKDIGNVPVVGGAIKGVAGAASAVVGWTVAFAKLLSNLNDSKFWLRVGQGFAAGLLFLLGLGLVFRNEVAIGSTGGLSQVAKIGAEVAA